MDSQKAQAWPEKSKFLPKSKRTIKTNAYSITFGGMLVWKIVPILGIQRHGLLERSTPKPESTFFLQIWWWFSKITSGMILGLNLSSRNCGFRKPVSFSPNSDLPLFDPSFPQTFDQNWNRIRFCGVLILCNRSKIQSIKSLYQL